MKSRNGIIRLFIRYVTYIGILQILIQEIQTLRGTETILEVMYVCTTSGIVSSDLCIQFT